MGPVESTVERLTCSHCGNLFLPRFEEEKFCCSGCRVVHDLIQSEGYASFYDLLGRKVIQPADQTDLNEEQHSDLAEAVAEAEENRKNPEAPAVLTLRIGNLSCTACVWLIDHLFNQYEGALRMSSNTSRSTLTLWWNPGEFDIRGFVAELQRYGYPASIASDEETGKSSESKVLLTRLGVTGGLAMNTMAFTLPTYLGLETSDDLARLFSLVALASATLAFAVGGSYFFQRAWKALQGRTLHMDVPISLGLIAAFLGSLAGMVFGIDGLLYFDFVATFAFLMLGGRWLHLRLLEHNRRQLWAREKNFSTATRITTGGERERIALREIVADDTLEIAPGGIVPVTSILSGGKATLHLDWINGEPEPVSVQSGSEIPAGAKNGNTSPILTVAREPFAGSFLQSLLHLPEDERASSDETETTTSILKWYLTSVLVIACLGFVSWIVISQEISLSLQVLISILVVSCPCALGLALPLLNEVILSRLKESGIFIRRDTLWQRLRHVTNLDFDKTGTLTEPVKRLSNPESLTLVESTGPDAVLALRILTKQNSHPIGKALNDVILTHYGELSCDNLPTVSSIDGKGVSVTSDDAEWRLGRSDWTASERNTHQNSGCTFSKNRKDIATFHFAETVRDGAKEQLRKLTEKGYRLRILSGDPNSERVKSTAELLGLPPTHVHANLSPEKKAEFLQSPVTGNTLFLGDGGNDSLAFSAADVSGTPATGIKAIEDQADFVFTGRGFHALGILLATAKRRNHFVVAIFSTAILYNLIAISICLAGFMNPLLAAILMPISSIITTAIAARA